MTQRITHPYHLVEPSPWPFVTALAALVLAVGGVLYVHAHDLIVFFIGLSFLLICLFGWFRDVVKEAFIEKQHTPAVQRGLRYGMALFILSEVMFFVGFFWAFFNTKLFPLSAIGAVWPPKDVIPIDPFKLPYLNTLILLLSASSLTWAHQEMREGSFKIVTKGLAITICLGLIFTGVQAYEYVHADFTIKSGIYGSNFYMLTGCHGIHVIIGTIFLIVCFFRNLKRQFTADHHIGFEAAAWYWHFVDVVWLFLFVFVYWWGT